MCDVADVLDPGGSALGIWGGANSVNQTYENTAETAEQARQKAITQGTGYINDAFSGYNTDYYNQYKQDYLNNQMPQLSSQYIASRNSLTNGLSNKGLLNSSVASQGVGTLQSDLASSQRNIYDTAVSKKDALQSNVEDQKSTLLSQLYTSADPGAAKTSATSTASKLAVPSVWGSLGNAFTNLGDYYSNNQATSYYDSLLNQNNSYSPYYGYGMSGNSGGSNTLGSTSYNTP